MISHRLLELCSSCQLIMKRVSFNNTGGKNQSSKRGSNYIPLQTPETSQTSVSVSTSLPNVGRKKFFLENDGQLLLSYSGASPFTIQQSIFKYLIYEFKCTSCAILNLIPPFEEFRVYAYEDSPQKKYSSYTSSMFTGVLETLTSQKCPMILDRNLEPWNQIFKFTPTCLIMVPVFLPTTIDQKQGTRRKTKFSFDVMINTISVLAFKLDTLPGIFLEEYTWTLLVAFCKLNAPLLINMHYHLHKEHSFAHFDRISQAVRKIEKEMQDLNSCINAIGQELRELLGAGNAIVFVLQDDMYEPLIVKYEIIGFKKDSPKCPDRTSHVYESFPQTTKFPAGWTALTKTNLVINDEIAYANICGAKGPIHSVHHCLVSNMMCIYIDNQTMDMPLVVEVSDKEGGFNAKDEIDAKIFAQRVSSILSTANLLEYRKNAIRRNEITNKILSNITKVHFNTVKHLLSFKFQYTSQFTKKFYTINFSFHNFPREQYAGVILFMFQDLDLITRWKIRRSTLIRFILSLRQGYIENPYHNWQHACTVTHFAFYILKRMELQKQGYLSDIEALSLIIACLCHDISHHGVNNHFSVFAATDSHHLQSREESLVERHHVVVALNILSTDDCNIAENLTDAEFKELIELIQWNVIATDIGKYLAERNEHFATLKKFSKKKKEHRKVFLSVLMTVCDLCENIKPWNNYITTVKNIFDEFFEQGDEELKLGYKPTPIMDRRIAYVPYIELKFINEIVRPCYEVVAKLLPKMKDCLVHIDYYKELWIVATNVFDKNAHLVNILEVLDNSEMKETNLKENVSPELEQEVRKIRHERNVPIAPMLLVNNARPSSVSRLSIMGHSSILVAKQSSSEESLDEDEDDERDNKMQKFKEFFMNFCCCLKWRQKALYDAHIIRKNHHEAIFMEARSEEYERLRIDQFFGGKYVVSGGKNARERINSLISPNSKLTSTSNYKINQVANAPDPKKR